LIKAESLKSLTNQTPEAYRNLNCRFGIEIGEEPLGTLIQEIFQNLAQIVPIDRRKQTESLTFGSGTTKQRNRVIGVDQMGQSQAFTAIHEPEPNYFELGVNYSCGRKVDADLIEAHKWFNIAAMRGDLEAARRRQEIASELSAFEIAAAQRRAREWLSVH
jgi:uncharacterized protein